MIMAAVLVLLTLAAPVWSATCYELNHAGTSYALCEVDLRSEDLRLFLYRDTNLPFGQFNAIEQVLNDEGYTLGFAMNAGMYHSDRSPVGHYIENGRELMRVIPNAGPGNFGLLPNGVFCIRPGRADVIETLRYIADKPLCTFATQSGPMLVIDGELHPRFLVDSTSRYIRNGVGTSADGKRAFFAISNSPVTFHEFGTFFRDIVRVPDALYFDGNVSRLYAPAIGRNDHGFAMGPIVGTVERAGAD